jgi:hypothetical protein
MALAVPHDSLGEAQERWGKAQASGAKYKVPGSEVAIDAWKAKAFKPSLLLEVDERMRRTFEFFYRAMRRSRWANLQQMSLDFATFPPISGNAKLLRLGGDFTDNLELQQDLVTEIYEDGVLVEIRIEQLGATEKERKRASAFHPLRTHDFFIVFNPGESFGYCFPTKKFGKFFTDHYWSGEQFVHIPASKVVKSRFTITGPDWFGDMYEDIMSPSIPWPQRQPVSGLPIQRPVQRPEHVIPDNAVPEDYAIMEEAEREPEDPLTDDEFLSYPWWKIEHWNRCAARKGYGVYIPLGLECGFANVVWMGYRWSVQEKVRFSTTQQLPVCFHQGDVDPDMPLLLIRVISARTTDNLCTIVSGRDLKDGGFPCLYYVDSGDYCKKPAERSGTLFPSEFIDRVLLEKRLRRKVGTEVTSESGEDDKASETRESVDDSVKLEQYLLAPCTLFQVREGDDFNDAIRGFFKAHAKDEKPVAWYGCGREELTAKDVYVVSARDVWQKIADEWIPAGTIKILGREAKQTGDDDPDLGINKGLGATRDCDGQDVDEDDGVHEDIASAGDDGSDGIADGAGNEGSTQIQRENVTQMEAWWT